MEMLAGRRRSLAAGILASLIVAVLAARSGAAQGAAGGDAVPDEQQMQRAPGAGAAAAPVPVRVFTDERGRSCRVYARTVVIDGESRTAFATVCREPSGRWVLSR